MLPDDTIPYPLFSRDNLNLPTTSTPSVPNQHFRFVTSGKHGTHGLQGIGGEPGQRGQNGQFGEHGFCAQPLHLNLFVRQEEIIAEGRSTLQNERSVLPLSDPTTSIFLDASGGRGGDGGAGGYGGNGIDGLNGENATKYRVGGNGENGQDGGDGADGGQGGYGGDGANLDIIVHQQDADILMLIKSPPSVAGGSGGHGGCGGIPGVGGHGGIGGNAFHWTERHVTPYVQPRSNGSVGMGTRIDTTQHSNPGGVNGVPGRNGNEGRPGAPGRPGSNGNIAIRVTDLGMFTWRYDLQIAGDVQVRDLKGYGVLEPGSECAITYSFSNVGAMPTPSQQDILMTIHPTSCISPHGDYGIVRIQPFIPPAETMSLDRPIQFIPTDIENPIVGNPLKYRTEILHRATVTRVNQDFPLVSNQATSVSINFPLELSYSFGQVCFVEGCNAIVAYNIRNVSDKPIAYDAPTPRASQTRILGIDFNDDSVIADEDGLIDLALKNIQHVENAAVLSSSLFTIAENSLDGISSFVKSSGGLESPTPLLQPGQSVTVTRLIRAGRLADAETGSNLSRPQDMDTKSRLEPVRSLYAQASLLTYLELGHPRNLDSLRPLQIRPFQVQLAEPFEYHHGLTKVLLVVNNRTTPQEIADWRSLVSQQFNLPHEQCVSVWNVSLYGGISFKYKVYNATDTKGATKASKLGQLFSEPDSVIIFLNNLCSPTGIRTGTSQQMPMEYLHYQELLHACKDLGCRFYIVGSSLGVNLSMRLRIAVDAENLHEFETVNDLLEGAPAEMFPEIAEDTILTNEPKSPAAAWINADIKGVLKKKKQSGNGKVTRTFVLRRKTDELLYYKQDYSKTPSASFNLADCSIVEANTLPKKSRKKDGASETLTIQTESRMLVLSSATKEASAEPSLSEWRQEIEAGIASARRKRGNAGDLKEPRNDIDFSRPQGYDKYCSAKIISRNLLMTEGNILQQAENISMELSMQHPEYETVVTYNFVKPDDRDQIHSITNKKRQVGELAVYMGLQHDDGNVIIDHFSAADSEDFVHNGVFCEKNRYALLKALRMSGKMRLLKFSRQDGNLGDCDKNQGLHSLVDAILSDIADENVKFRYGEVGVGRKLSSMVSKRSDTEIWANRLTCLSMVAEDNSLGKVESGSNKMKELVRLCVNARLLIKLSVPMKEKMLKVSRVGLIARASTSLLDKLERNLATAVGIEKVSMLCDKNGRTIAKATAHAMKEGLEEGDGKLEGEKLLRGLRMPFGVGMMGADREDGRYEPLVLKKANFDQLRSKFVGSQIALITNPMEPLSGVKVSQFVSKLQPDSYEDLTE